MSPRGQREARAIGALCPLLLMAACAVGYDGAGSEYPEPDPTASLPPFMGEACSPVGDRVVCTCASGGMGLRACVQNPSSPTKGALTDCLNCMTPMTSPPPTGMAGTNQGDAPMASGMGGRGAAGGRASGRGDAAAGGTGSSTTGGGRAGSAARSGGSSGTGGRGSSGACNCTNDCFPIGILACCRLDGSCGCTWAPGAYCG
jgi:hypothetical protein